MSRLRVVAVVLAVLAMSAVAMARSKPPAYETKITIREPSTANYEGRVKSDKTRCFAHRPLRMWRPLPGPDERAGGPFESEADGSWSFVFVGTTKYYVVAKRERFTKGRHDFVCKRGRSPAA